MFAPEYLPFWVVSYCLSAVAWTCVGRFLLSFFIHPDSANYIWRAFRLITDWAVVATAFVTPRVVPGLCLAPIAALWVFVLRFVAALLLAEVGLVPSLGVPPGGRP